MAHRQAVRDLFCSDPANGNRCRDPREQRLRVTACSATARRRAGAVRVVSERARPRGTHAAVPTPNAMTDRDRAPGQCRTLPQFLVGRNVCVSGMPGDEHFVPQARRPMAHRQAVRDLFCSDPANGNRCRDPREQRLRVTACSATARRRAGAVRVVSERARPRGTHAAVPTPNAMTDRDRAPGQCRTLPQFLVGRNVCVSGMPVSAPWRHDLQRRVQHYGWRYDYRAHRRHHLPRRRLADALPSRAQAPRCQPEAPPPTARLRPRPHR